MASKKDAPQNEGVQEQWEVKNVVSDRDIDMFKELVQS